ncbi:DUF2314 domain-containing protein [Acinetobacter kyonggiensis]|uniref:DUF2314 domain-containing protein n=1 Tax=Acinetobacter kyonggiensis TaxID=595670 RepID=A0A1H3FFN0_9GAMM|nr:DUF2314 domain-containing protein [Acinetobacter kyonggiensis]SDX89178.1 hypothetical protein SAMN05421643_10111 [Acinetobacter kyonggiensis]
MNSELEPQFMLVDHEADAYLATIKIARESLDIFKENLAKISEGDFACVKFYIPESQDSEEGANIWLMTPFFEDNFCFAQLFEVPEIFKWIQVGQWLKLSESEILDWYILKSTGEMFGGYSLRYQRSKLSPVQQVAFDQRVGVTRFVDL